MSTKYYIKYMNSSRIMDDLSFDKASAAWVYLINLFGSEEAYRNYEVVQDQYIEEACMHSEHEHGHCLDCGEDRTEHMMADAYDRAKDLLKYGE